MRTTSNEPTYFEKLTNAESQNLHLKALTAGLVVMSCLLAAGWYRAERPAESVQPFVVSVDENGKPHVRDAGEVRYEPTEQVMKYFLTTFVTAHLSRQRATVRRDFERSVLFLDRGLAASVIDEERTNRTIERFLADGDEETLIRVSNITIEDATGPVYKADIGYEKIFARDHREREREHHLLHVSFVMKRPVPVELIPVNPLGFLIVSMADSGPALSK